MKKYIFELSKLLSEFKTWLILIIPTACVLFYFAILNTNIGFLQIYSIDEYVFHGSVRHMYESLLTGNLSGVFGYGFYQYGFVYFFLNLLASIPGLATDNTALAVIAPRLVTSFFAISSLVVIYHFARLYIEKIPALLFATLFITMPAFWFNATWFHPDWPMTFWLLCFVYFLARDNWEFKQNFYLAIMAYGLAIAFKYQAITFAPILGLYIFYNLFRHGDLSNWYTYTKRLGLSLLGIITIFVFCNPYILHPMGWRAFSASFVINMVSNATNHGVAIDVTVIQKISEAITAYYLNILFLFLLSTAAVWLMSRFYKQTTPSLFIVLATNYIINIIFLLLFVNKAWQVYYLPVMVLGLLTIVHFAKDLSVSRLTRYLFIGIVIQIVFFSPSYVHIMTTGRDSSAPDYITYSTAEQKNISDFINQSLQGLDVTNATFLLSSYTPFEYEKHGITYEHVDIIFGPLGTTGFDQSEYLEGQRRYWGDLKTDAELLESYDPAEYIILRKDVPYIQTELISDARDKDAYLAAHRIITGLYNGTYDFKVLAENDLVVIFQTTQVPLD